MLLARRGDRGPRVIMIQGILRAYGNATAAAVSAFQQRAGWLRADGSVGLETWRAIERITGYHIVNVVDAEDSAQRQRVCSGLIRAGGNPIIMYGMCNAVAAAMDEVTSRAGTGGMMAMVRFYSHGGPGMQNIASGRDGNNMEHLSGVSVQHLPAMRAQFERLNDLLAPFGCVDMMGCSTASPMPPTARPRPASRSSIRRMRAIPSSTSKGGKGLLPGAPQPQGLGAACPGLDGAAAAPGLTPWRAAPGNLGHWRLRASPQYSPDA